MSETCKGGIRSFLMNKGVIPSDIHIVSSVSLALLSPDEAGRSFRNALSRSPLSHSSRQLGVWGFGPYSPIITD